MHARKNSRVILLICIRVTKKKVNYFETAALHFVPSAVTQETEPFTSHCSKMSGTAVSFNQPM